MSGKEFWTSTNVVPPCTISRCLKMLTFKSVIPKYKCHGTTHLGPRDETVLVQNVCIPRKKAEEAVKMVKELPYPQSNKSCTDMC